MPHLEKNTGCAACFFAARDMLAEELMMVAVAAVLSTVVAGGEGAGAANALPWWGNRPKGAARRRRRGQAQSQAFPIWSAGEAVPRASPGDAVPRVKMGHASVATPTSERKRGETTPLPTRKTRGGRAGASARHALCCRTAATLPRRDEEEGIKSGKSETIHAQREGKREGRGNGR